MVERVDRSKRGRRGAALQRPTPARARRCCSLLALLAVASAPVAFGQTKNTAHFLPSKTSTNSSSGAASPAGAQPLAVRPLDEQGLVGTAGYYLGTSTVNGGTVQQQVVEFTTESTSASFVPTVGLQYGKSYSLGPLSCAQTYSQGAIDPYIETCTVTVTFAPLYPGGHKDAVYAFDADGKTQLSGAFLYGIGQAPLLLLQPGVITSVGIPTDGYGYAYTSTVDEGGTVYVIATTGIFSIKNGVVTLFTSSIPFEAGTLQVDGAGNVFTAASQTTSDVYNAQNGNFDFFLSYTLPGYTVGPVVYPPVTTTYYSPEAVAPGNLGNFYEADGGRGSGSEDGYQAPALVSTTYTPEGKYVGALPGYGLPFPVNNGSFYPNAMTLDPSENLYFSSSSGVYEYCNGLPLAGVISNCSAVGTMIQLNQVSNGNSDGELSMDAAGTLYVSGWNGYSGVVMFSNNNNYATPLARVDPGGGIYGSSVAQEGTVYVSNLSTVDIVDRSQDAIDWGSNNGQTSNPQTITIYNGGNEPLSVPSIAISGDGYTMSGGATNPCSNGMVIVAGAICQLAITSTPPHPGTLPGAVTITSNSLNQAGTLHTIPMTGYVSGIYVTASPNPLDVGYVPPGQTSTTPVTLINTSAGSNSVGYGSSTIVNGTFTSSNPAFSAMAGTCNVAEASGGPNCQIQVTFNPALAQSYTGTITWRESIDGGGPSQNMSLAVSGTGINPVILLPLFETITVSDGTPSTVPATLLPLLENITVSDGMPSTVPATQLPLFEAITVSDGMPTTVAATQLPLFEAITVSDGMPMTVAATQLPLFEAIHLTDAVSPVALPTYTTTTALASSASTVAVGATVGLTATVHALGTTSVAVGPVSFYEDGSLLGSASLSGGVAGYTTPTLTSGSHGFTAVYAGGATSSVAFDGSTSSTVSVDATTLHVLTITAVSSSRAFETANPAFTYNATGFVNGDTNAVLSGAPAETTGATPNSPAGSYPIAISQGTLSAPSKYAFNFVPGTLTVTGAAAQTLEFLPLPAAISLGFGKLTLTAHSSSGVPITYTVSGPATLSGYTLTLTGTGTVTVTATQPGTSTFAPATSVVESFTVTP